MLCISAPPPRGIYFGEGEETAAGEKKWKLREWGKKMKKKGKGEKEKTN